MLQCTNYACGFLKGLWQQQPQKKAGKFKDLFLDDKSVLVIYKRLHVCLEIQKRKINIQYRLGQKGKTSLGSFFENKCTSSDVGTT